MKEHLFQTLQAFENIPDQKHRYVSCRFYNKQYNFSLYVREDLKIYQYQIFRFEYASSDITIRGYAANKEIQRHPVSGRIVHMDFYLIDDPINHSIRIKLPIKYENLEKCSTIKLGGRLNITSRALEVRVFKGSTLPPYGTVDVSRFKDNESISLKDILLPDGVVPIKAKMAIATVMPSKGGEG
jgi:Ribosomal protein TL5, C-terminal domain